MNSFCSNNDHRAFRMNYAARKAQSPELYGSLKPRYKRLLFLYPVGHINFPACRELENQFTAISVHNIILRLNG